MSLTSPTISVIMAVHNARKYLEKSIQTILQQTLDHLEFIIINDGSTDDSGSVIRDFADGRIRLFQNKGKMGLTKCLNIAVKHSRGKYIARMDADDEADIERLRKQLAYLESHPKIGVLGTNFYEIDESGKILGEVYLPETDDEIRKKIFKFNPFFHGSTMVPRDVFENVGLYNEQFQYAQDYELWFRILKKYRAANLRDLLMKKRKHSGRLTQKKLRQQFYFAYRACMQGRDRIGVSCFDRLSIMKYKILSKLPPQLILLADELRPYKLNYYFSGHYVRDTR